jgi:hypothetical protein
MTPVTQRPEKPEVYNSCPTLFKQIEHVKLCMYAVYGTSMKSFQHSRNLEDVIFKKEKIRSTLLLEKIYSLRMKNDANGGNFLPNEKG